MAGRTRADLLRAVARRQLGVGSSDSIPRRAQRVAPLSYAQSRVWFVEQLQPDGSLFNVPMTLHLIGPLDVDALRRAISEIVRRHEILRTRFTMIDGEPRQQVLDAAPVELPVVNSFEPELDGLIREELERPFDLEKDPLIRSQLIRLADEDHYLLLTMHHIVSDGWSRGILRGELSALYNAFASSMQSPLAELPVQYSDYASWQREWLSGETLQRQLDYWTNQLAGAPQLLEIPTDRPRQPFQTSRGAAREIEMPASLLESLESIARQEDATLFMVLLAAFEVLLHRYSGQDDIVVGTAISNRMRPELEGVIGFFLNTLPLRVDLSGDPTFKELLRRVKKTALDAYAHQDLPFEKLVEELAPERSLSHSPVFQALFTLQNAPGGSVRLEGIQIQRVRRESTVAKFDLSLILAKSRFGLNATLEYNSDLFNADRIERMLGHYQTLLEAIASESNQPIGRLPMLTEREQRQILVDWNNSPAEYPHDRCIHQIVEEQARRSPDALAVASKDGVISYAELNGRANQIARHLRTHGIGPESLVGVYMDRSIAMVVALLGILKAGGAYVPLDPSYPPDRLKFMVEDCGARLILARHDRLPAFEIDKDRLVVLQSDEVAVESADDLELAAGPDNLAYVIYTSGSTGQPKGVEICHPNLMNLVSWHVRTYGLTPDDRTTQVARSAFDASVWEIWPTFAAGASLWIADDDTVASPPDLVNWLNQNGITLTFLPTPLAESVLAEDSVASLGIRSMLTGGDRLHSSADPKWPFQLINHYGPTESTVVATAGIVETGDDAPPIGRPIDNTQIYLLDNKLMPVPVGIPGELYIGGSSLARGYLKRPELTAERFVPNPFTSLVLRNIGGSSSGLLDSRVRGNDGYTSVGGSELRRLSDTRVRGNDGSTTSGEPMTQRPNDPTTRLYKTGDLCRYRPDGSIEFLGRADHQVKIRGFRIELGEIESALLAHPWIRECVVMTRGEDRLVAYLVGSGESMPVTEMREHLRAKLPEYMVPSAFVAMDALPLSPNGKVDRKALPEMDLEASTADAQAAPRTPFEEGIAEIWREVLRAAQVSIHDNFFDLGGHSLLATQAVSRIRKTFNVELPLRALFESPTVAGLAERVSQSHGITVPPILPADRTKALPLSFSQQRLWFIHQLDPLSPAYNIPKTIRLIGSLDADALQRAIETVVQRHESLRTTFAFVDGQAVQQINDCAPTIERIDLSELAPDDRDRDIQRTISNQSRRPFDLERGPLFRATLIKLGDDEHILALVMHHIVSDGWSIGLLLSELRALYTGRPLQTLPIQYSDYAAWQRSWLQGEALETQLSYWRNQLSGAPAVLELPTDRPRPPMQTTSGARTHLWIEPELAAGLSALGQRHGATMFMITLATFQALLHRYTGQDDIVVGTPIANRTREELEGVIGFFVNTLALRVSMSESPTFEQLLGRVRESCLGAYAHQDMPFDRLVDELAPERTLTHSPIFQVMFSFQPAGSGADPDWSGLQVESVAGEGVTAKHDLFLAVSQSPRGLRLGLEYNTDLFNADRMERLLGHYQALIQAIIADPGARVSNLPLLTGPERHELLVEWNDTAADYPRDICLHELFERQSARTPDAVAVACRNSELTYRELNDRANLLAHYLQGQGLGPESLVAICMDRSLDMIVGVLGILKAGAAYVALDPAYPLERLRFTLIDSKAALVLTQERLAHLIPSVEASVVCVDRHHELIASQPSLSPSAQVDPANLAYVLYTSGSTGVPKGVAIEHRSPVALVTWAHEAFSLDELSRTVFATSLCFDLSVFELFVPLCCGCTVIVADNALAIGQLPDESAPTLINTVPSAIAELIRQKAIPASVTTVNLAGEPLNPALVDDIYRTSNVRKVYDLYGPSEDTTYSTCALREPLTGETIGRPLANTRIYLLDRHGQPVPIGVPGELCIGSASLARGYLNRPDLTAERFVPNPFTDDILNSDEFLDSRPRGNNETLSSRLYRTGDLARYLPDGNIEFLGRRDHQVKIRGFRIELGEIEDVLAHHPGVRESVVVAREDTRGEKRLAAYVVPLNGDLNTHELREHLGQKLPGYMIPSAFVLLDELPLSPNGKVDRNALPAPELARRDFASGHEEPRTAAEESLAAIWRNVLRVDRVGIHDNFFELGGDSIQTIQIVARASQAGLRITPRQMFEYQTIAGLAVVAESGGSVDAEQGTVEGSVPLTPIQHWFFEQDLASPHHFNQARLLRLSSNVTSDIAERAVKALIAHHDALRLRFDLADGRWNQHNSGQEANEVFTQIDLTSLAPEDRPVALTDACAEVQGSLNLSTGPLIRAAYIRMNKSGCFVPQHDSRPQDDNAAQVCHSERSEETAFDARLLLAIHHLAVDGVSWRILLEDLEREMVQAMGGQPITSEKTTSFKRWAEMLTVHADSEAIQNESSYWSHICGQAVAKLPIDHAGGANTVASQRTIRVSLDEQETGSLLHDVSGAYHTQINDMLLTALAQTMHRWTGKATAWIDLEGHGREDIFEGIDLSRTVGWFTSLYPIRLELPAGSHHGAAIKSIKEQLRTIPNRGLGYGILRYLARSLTRAADPQVSFNYHGQVDSPGRESSLFELARESAGPTHAPEQLRSHLLDIVGSVRDNRLHMTWIYSDQVHERSTIERLANGYLDSLRDLIAHCKSAEAGGYTPSDFSDADIDQDELDQLLSAMAQ